MVGEFCLLCVRWKRGVCGVFMPEGSALVEMEAWLRAFDLIWTGKIHGRGSKEGRSAGQEIELPDWFAGQGLDR
jgi:hypothetical protein